MTAADFPYLPPAAGPRQAPPLRDTPEERDALQCPLCRYSLRGLASAEHPRCPECGYRFEWAELLGARQHAHRYLFEHQRGFRAFVYTLVGGMMPRRWFWTSLNAGHQIVTRRLVRYWFLTALLILLTGAAGTFVTRAVTTYRQAYVWTPISWRTARARTYSGPRLDAQFFRQVAQQAFSQDTLELYLIAAALAWPWLTFAALSVYQASMRRARVRPGHVLRCSIYCGDVFVWTGVALLALGALRYYDLISVNRIWDNRLAARQTLACFGVVFGVAGYRLGVAYRRYLRFDRPWASAVASQVLVFLLLVTVLSLVYDDFWKLLPESLL
jgi:hypothetical protein